MALSNGVVEECSRPARRHLQGEVGHAGDDDGVEGLRDCKVVRRPQRAPADLVKVEACHAVPRAPDLARRAMPPRSEDSAVLGGSTHAPGGSQGHSA